MKSRKKSSIIYGYTRAYLPPMFWLIKYVTTFVVAHNDWHARPQLLQHLEGYFFCIKASKSSSLTLG